MLSLAEYRRLSDDFQRKLSRRSCVLLFGGLLLMFLPPACLVGAIDRFVDDLGGIGTILLITIASIPGAVLAYKGAFDMEHALSPALACPHCGKQLNNTLLVTATGRCPNCRGQVIADLPSGTPPSLFQAAEVRSAADRQISLANWTIFPLMLLLLAWMVFSLAVNAWVSESSKGLAWVIVSGIAMLALALLIAGSVRAHRAIPSIQCWSCGQSLIGLGNITIATGRCGICGHRVLALPDDPALDSQ